MRAPPGDAVGTGTNEPPTDADERDRDGRDDLDRSERGHAGQRQPAWPWSRVGRFEPERPPRWFSSPLVLVAVLAGFVAFSSTWSVMGDAVVALSVATIVGTCIGSGTVVAGSLLWINLTDRPAAPGY